jgi:hypothetical protein
MLPQLAQGNANKVWVIPSEFSQALGSVVSSFTDGVPAKAKPRPRDTDEIDAKAAADAEEAARAAAEASAAALSATDPGGGARREIPPAPPAPPEA